MTGPWLWYLNRATGVVLLVLCTLAVLAGIWSALARPGRRLPRFVVQGLHRNLSLLAVGLLSVHVASAVLDEYVDIRWWQAVLPFGASYRPLWLGLGAVALDLLVVLVVTSLLRVRLGLGGWRATHQLAYLAWAVAVLHGLGIGTDVAAPWMRATTWACLGTVALAVALRLAVGLLRPPAPAAPLLRRGT